MLSEKTSQGSCRLAEPPPLPRAGSFPERASSQDPQAQRLRRLFADARWAPLSSAPVDQSWLPLDGVLYSLLLHAVLACGILMLPPLLAQLLHNMNDVELNQLRLDDHAINYLPPVKAAGNEGARARGAIDAAAAPSNGHKKLMVYKGPQRIVSDPPKADNTVQTVRQPDLVQPPKFAFPMPLPSMALFAKAESKPVLQARAAPAPKLETPRAALAVKRNEARAEVPKLAVPLDGKMPQLSAKATAMPVLSQPAAAPTPPAAHASNTNSEGSDDRNLLVVNAVQVQARPPAEIPAGELHGAFEVTNAKRGTDSVSGAGKAASTGNGQSAGKDLIASTSGGAGNADGDNLEPRTSSGSGTSAAGKGAGAKASGAGAGVTGARSGQGPFLNITIQGGHEQSKAAVVDHSEKYANSADRNGSYGMTVVSNGAGGGGLRDYGAFHDEPVYTVYINTEDIGAPGPNWILQYAVFRADPRQPAAAGILAPPYAVGKQVPHFREMAAPYAGRMMVIFARVNAAGKIEAARVLQSPNGKLNLPLLDCLAQWKFQPATMNGGPVPVKIVLGIPITATME